MDDLPKWFLAFLRWAGTVGICMAFWVIGQVCIHWH